MAEHPLDVPPTNIDPSRRLQERHLLQFDDFRILVNVLQGLCVGPSGKTKQQAGSFD